MSGSAPLPLSLFRHATSVVLLLGACFSAGESYGDLDSRFFPPSGWEAFEYPDPGGWVELEAEKEGIPSDDPGVDVSSRIQEIADAHVGERVRLTFGSGTWTFRKTCAIRKPGGGLAIRGAGAGKTRFVLDTPEGEASELSILGWKAAPGIGQANVDALRRGDDAVTIRSGNASRFRAGDFVMVLEGRTIPKDSDFPDGICPLPAQIVRLDSVEGRTLRLDMKIGVAMGEPKIRSFPLGSEVGFEGFSLFRKNDAPKNTRNLRLSGVSRGFIRDCEIADVITGGIWLDNCRDVEVSRNAVHDMMGKVEGGRGDGIVLGNGCTRIHVTGNRVWNARHHIITLAADHCVIAYNRCESNFAAYGDLAQHNGHHGHNNLFEGNVGSELVTDDARKTYQPTWFITYFRNRAFSSLGSVSRQSESYSLIANEIDGLPGNERTPVSVPSKGAAGLLTIGADPFVVGANRVKGRMEWGGLTESSRIPPSLVHSRKPASVEKWPLFGPP